MRSRLFLFLLTMWLSVPVMGHAEETLYLKNGDKLVGKQLGLQDGVLLWEWRDGVLEFPFADVEKIDYTLAPDDQESRSLVLMTPGQVFAPPADHVPLEIILPPPPEPPPPSFFKTFWDEYLDWLRDGMLTWTERLELGGSFLKGNTNQDAFNVGAKFSRDTEWNKTQINLGGQYAQSGAVLTANRWFGDTTTDFKRKDKWMTYVRSLHEYDQFANLDYRGTLSLGVGYRFVDKDPQILVVRIGPGVTQEYFHTPKLVRTTPDMLVELEAKTLIWNRIVLEEKITTHPSISNWELVRILNTTSFLIPLDQEKRWNLKVGFRYEYSGVPNANRDPNDFATTVNIVYTRK